MSKKEGESRKKKENEKGTKQMAYQTMKSRERTMRHMVQVTFLMGILNNEYSFQLRKSAKQTSYELFFPLIVQINDKTEVIYNFDNAMDEKSKNWNGKKSLDEYPREKRRTYRVVVNNFLFDMANFVGYQIRGKSTSSKIGKEQIERINQFVYNKKKYEWNDIVNVSLQLNKILFNIIERFPKGTKYVTIELNDLYNPLMDLLNVHQG